MRRATALLATAALIGLALTGCSANSGDCVAPGDASKLVRATGDFGSPVAKVPTPLYSSDLQASVIKRGTGKQIQNGQVTTAAFSFLDAKTGKAAQAPGLVQLLAGSDNYPGLEKAILCQPVGSRIAVTGTAKQIFGANGTSADTTKEPVAFVLDIKSAIPSRATGAARPSQPGFPTVVLDPSGQPGVTIPKHDPPKSVKTEVLKQGDGKTVKKTSSQVVVQYTAVSWADNTVTSSSWTAGAPVTWPSTSDQSFQPPAHVLKALIGKNVGSQIVVITPNDSSGSGAAAYVIDILHAS